MKKIHKITITVIILIITTLLIILAIKNIGTKEKIKIQINNEEIILANEDETFDKSLEMLNSSKTIIKNCSNSTIYINDTKVKAQQSIELTELKIDRETTIKIKVKFSGNIKSTTYNILTLPEDFPEYEATGESKYPGDYYFTSFAKKGLRSYLIKVNSKGEIIFYKKTRSNVYDFRKIKLEDKIRYTYMELITRNKYDIFCDLVVLNENYIEIDRVQYKLPDGMQIGADNHDTIYLDDGHYILVTNQDKEVDNMPEEIGYGSKMKVSNCLIQEIKDGNILWQFESADYPELYTQYSPEAVIISGVSAEYYGNYMHFNSCEIDKEDGNLICSFRNLDEVIKIDRKTGKIIWILGGKGDQFGLTEEQKFSKQHCLTFLKDNSILMYDNGGKNRESRILKIKLDEQDKKVTNYIEYKLDVFSKATGSVQVVDEENNIYLICYGNGDYRGKRNIEEKNLETGETYFTFEILNDNAIETALKIE